MLSYSDSYVCKQNRPQWKKSWSMVLIIPWWPLNHDHFSPCTFNGSSTCMHHFRYVSCFFTSSDICHVCLLLQICVMFVLTSSDICHVCLLLQIFVMFVYFFRYLSCLFTSSDICYQVDISPMLSVCPAAITEYCQTVYQRYVFYDWRWV